MVVQELSEPLTAPAVAGSHDDGLAFLLVEVDGLRCGLPAGDVFELHPVVATVAIPGAPAVVDGAIDVRGSVVAVLDVRARLGLPPREPLLSDHLVVCRVGRRTLALRVDRAVELASISLDAIDATHDLPGANHVTGVARMPDGLVLIHDLASFLSADEDITLGAALDRLGAGGEQSG